MTDNMTDNFTHTPNRLISTEMKEHDSTKGLCQAGHHIKRETQLFKENLMFQPVIKLNSSPIEVTSSVLTVNEHGAGNFFLGRVRSRNCGKDVVAVEYDSFIPLAKKTMQEIATEAQVKFGAAHIEIFHRIGRLSVGEISVAIIVSTPHRDESYKISRYIIEEIKTRAPIWKKEYYTDGETEWLKGHALCQHGKVE